MIYSAGAGEQEHKNIDRKKKNTHQGCIFHHSGGTLPFKPWNPNFACVVGSTK